MEDSGFVIDEVYEHINAPKWVDFTAADSDSDEAWFGCDHQQEWVDSINHQKKHENEIYIVVADKNEDEEFSMKGSSRESEMECGMRYCCLYGADVIISWADYVQETLVNRFIRRGCGLQLMDDEFDDDQLLISSS